jgi:bacteriorhodopsin
MTDLFTLTPTQYSLVLNILNLSIGAFGAFSLLFILLRRNVARNYSIAISLMAAVTAMAAYHYFRLYGSWLEAYALQGGQHIPTGAAFNYVVRYADWLGTVPLLLSAIMLVLDLGRQQSASLVTRMATSAVLMIGLGYIGEVQGGNLGGRAVWGLLACIPFLYILYVLWGEMSRVLSFESVRVRQLFSRLRWVLLASWIFYPVIYALPILGISGPNVLTLVQLSNSAADLLAKVGVGLLILGIAREKTEEDLAAASRTEKAQTAGQAGSMPTPVAAD